MIADIGQASRVIYFWGGGLNIPQIIGGLVFIAYIEAQVVLAAAILTLLLAGQIHKKTPFSRLIGLCHIPWLLLLPWLVYRITVIEHTVWLEFWLYYTSITIAVSLVFDALDVYRFSKGQRTFAWSEYKSE
jgi:hypothetical protein